ALTPSDIDIEKEMININKSYQRLEGKDYITSPKTEESYRIIKIPDFLAEELNKYMNTLYKIKPNERIFEITKGYLHNEMTRGCKISGVERIKLHSLRHSAISLLIDMGFSALAIADRVGHESINITYNYAHLFPSRQTEMAENLILREVIFNVKEKLLKKPIINHGLFQQFRL
ncbi:MAG: site-specific integrase, partial [Lachnospirales bacterium]